MLARAADKHLTDDSICAIELASKLLNTDSKLTGTFAEPIFTYPINYRLQTRKAAEAYTEQRMRCTTCVIACNFCCFWCNAMDQPNNQTLLKVCLRDL